MGLGFKAWNNRPTRTGTSMPWIYHAGRYFTENPGSHHITGKNTGKTGAAGLAAIFVSRMAERY